MSDEPEAAEVTEEEGEAVAPALSADPILGDQRSDVETIGPGGEGNIPEPETEAEGEAEAEPEAEG